MDEIRKFLQLDNIIPLAKTLPDELISLISDFVSPSIKEIKNLNDTLPNYLKFLMQDGGLLIGKTNHPLAGYNNLKNYIIFDFIDLEQIRDIDNIIQVAPLFYKLCNKGKITVEAKHQLENWIRNEQYSQCFRFSYKLYKLNRVRPNFKLINEPSKYIERSSVALAFFILKYPYKTSNYDDDDYLTFKIKRAPLITKKRLNDYFIEYNLPLLETYFHRFALEPRCSYH